MCECKPSGFADTDRTRDAEPESMGPSLSQSITDPCRLAQVLELMNFAACDVVMGRNEVERRPARVGRSRYVCGGGFVFRTVQSQKSRVPPGLLSTNTVAAQ